MHTNFETMTGWEIEKASYLVLTAKKLGMKLDCYGELSVNSSSGYTYLWLENYDFTLYMPINCDLKKEDVYVLHTDSITGEETEESLKWFNVFNDITKWIKTLQTQN